MLKLVRGARWIDAALAMHVVEGFVLLAGARSP